MTILATRLSNVPGTELSLLRIHMHILHNDSELWVTC